MLCNATFHNPLKVANELGAIAIGDPYPEFVEVEIAAETLQRYQGVYQIDEEQKRFVYANDGVLRTRRTGGGVLTARPHSETSFHYEDSRTHLEFIIEDGKVSGMKVFQNGSDDGEFASRVDEQLPPWNVAAEINTDVYDDYVGKYELMPDTGVEIEITRDGDRLIVHPPGDDEPAEIFPSSETVFAPLNFDGEFTFVRDSNGKVSELKFKLNSGTVRAKRIDGE